MFSLVAVIGLAIYYSKQKVELSQSGYQCSIDETLVCFFANDLSEPSYLTVKFIKKAQIEEENAFELIIPSGLRLVDGWVQGVNMYMGKMAIMEQDIKSGKKDNSHQRWIFFLGSCSEANMRWQLVLNFATVSAGKTETYFVNFTTSSD